MFSARHMTAGTLALALAVTGATLSTAAPAFAASSTWSQDDGEEPDEVTAFRVSDGSRRWTYYGASLGAGVAAGGKVLLTRTTGTGVVALDIVKGTQKWKSSKAWEPQAANPAGDSVYVTDPAGSLLSVKSATGAVAWAVKKIGGQVGSDGRRVYVSRGALVAAYEPKKGKRLWIKATAAAAGKPIRAGGLLYTSVEDEPLAIVNAATGAEVRPGNDQLYCVDHPAVAGGQLYRYDGSSLLAYGV